MRLDRARIRSYLQGRIIAFLYRGIESCKKMIVNMHAVLFKGVISTEREREREREREKREREREREREKREHFE